MIEQLKINNEFNSLCVKRIVSECYINIAIKNYKISKILKEFIIFKNPIYDNNYKILILKKDTEVLKIDIEKINSK